MKTTVLMVPVIMYDFTASCPCYATNNTVQTVCSGPSTAPCMCSGEHCMVSVWTMFS